MQIAQLSPETNRKIDHQPLPILDEAQPELVNEFVEPTAGVETTIAEIWSQCLGIARVSATDDFFDLGGSSILAVQMLAMLEKTTGQKIPAIALVQGETVRGMAEWMNRSASATEQRLLIALQETGDRLPLYLIPPTKGSALIFLSLARELGPEQPVFAFDDAAVQEYEWKIENLAAHYLREMRKVQPSGPYVIGGMCSGATIALEMVQQLTKSGQKVEFLLVLDGGAPGWGVPTDLRGKYEHYVKRLRDHISQNTVGYMVRTQLTLRWLRWTNRMTGHKRVRKYEKYQPQVTNSHIVLYESEERYRIRHHDRWQKWAGGGMDCQLVPGTTHKSVLKEQASVIFIARDLRERLAMIQLKSQQTSLQEESSADAVGAG